MSFFTEINKFRRILTRSLTKNIGRSRKIPKLNGDEHPHFKRILISRPNGRLGNLLMITPLLQEINTVFPDCKIDLFVKGNLAPILFKNYKNIDQIIRLPRKPFKELIKYIKVWTTIKKYHYDLVINIDKGSSSGRIATKISNSRFKIFGDEIENISEKYQDYQHMAKFPVYNFREYLALLGYPLKENTVASLNLKLSDSEILEGKKILKDLIKNDKKTISIFTYATCSKCYSTNWWEEFYGKLKIEFPDYNIIEILPIENVSQIDFKAITFYSKDIREIGSVIANTTIFIGADSGIMHLASATKTPTLGLFSVTDPKKYAPYNLKNIAIDTNYCICEDYIKTLKNMLD